MKNQFFGDKRDYFKFSLLEHLLQRTRWLTQLTCVWMLTQATTNTHGNLSLVASRGYEDLAAFLQNARATGLRDVREISRYYSSRCQFNSYGDDPRIPFGAARDLYFQRIPTQFLQSALVFVDPDNGLEPASGPSSAHLRFAEARALYSRLDAGSILVIYQHLPRRSPAVFWPEVGGKIAGALESDAFYVAERDVALYVIPKSGVASEVRATLENYVRLETIDGVPSSRVVGLSTPRPAQYISA